MNQKICSRTYAYAGSGIELRLYINRVPVSLVPVLIQDAEAELRALGVTDEMHLTCNRAGLLFAVTVRDSAEWMYALRERLQAAGWKQGK